MAPVPIQHKHVVSVDDMTPEWIEMILKVAQFLKVAQKEGLNSAKWLGVSTALSGQVMVNLFYEPSTRTRLSFDAAMQQLGGRVIGTEAAGMFSSAVKGESLTDTIHVCALYGHVIVQRHKQKGSAREAADLNVVSIINAGDGDGEHPTQALLDFFTIWEKFQGQSCKKITFVGDLKYGRTVHSLIKLIIALRDTQLDMFNRIQLVAPAGLELPDEYLDQMASAHIEVELFGQLSDLVVSGSDAIYMTRAQKERMAEGEGVDGNAYTLQPDMVELMSPEAMVLHPLPRNDELPAAIDEKPQARYFEQAGNGLFVRMALLLWIFGKLPEFD